LPKGTIVADKTGTLGGSVNDVGVITLPGSAGRVGLVVFVKKSAQPIAAREAAIADIARSIYDFYLFEPGR
ncbi:MAG: serine hydrolase, partial [Caulobacteraceae bacterium]